MLESKLWPLFALKLLRFCASSASESFSKQSCVLESCRKQAAVHVQCDTFSPVEGSGNMHVHPYTQLSQSKIGKMHKGELTWNIKIISINIRKSKHLIDILFNSTLWGTIYLLQGPVIFLPGMS